MLDEGLARCCFAALPGRVGVTARLEVDFRNVCRSEGFVVLKARTEKVEGRKAWVGGRVERLEVEGKDVAKKDGVAEGRSPWDERGEVLVEAKGLFISPKWAKVWTTPPLIRIIADFSHPIRLSPLLSDLSKSDSERTASVSAVQRK